MAEIPAPKNRAIDAAQTVLEKLIEGVGVEVAISAGTAAWPFLGAPIVRTIFRWLVEKLADFINTNLFHWSIKIILRIQSSARKDEFNEAIRPIIQGSATDEEIQRAKDAAIALIERNR